MTVYDWSTVPEEQLNPSLTRKAIHTPGMTVARIALRKSTAIPAHSHANEQVSMIEKGSLRFVLDGEERVVHAGEVLHIPPHAVHSVEALEESVAVDLFTPPRLDWIQGDDAYLRK